LTIVESHMISIPPRTSLIPLSVSLMPLAPPATEKPLLAVATGEAAHRSPPTRRAVTAVLK
jgi:hypothetical protein